MILPGIEATYTKGMWSVRFTGPVQGGGDSVFKMTHPQWLAFRAMQNGIFFTEPVNEQAEEEGVV